MFAICDYRNYPILPLYSAVHLLVICTMTLCSFLNHLRRHKNYYHQVNASYDVRWRLSCIAFEQTYVSPLFLIFVCVFIYFYTEGYDVSFNWTEFQHQNELLLELISTHYPNVIWMDIYPMTVLRADSHRDPLHYCIPGPIVGMCDCDYLCYLFSLWIAACSLRMLIYFIGMNGMT